MKFKKFICAVLAVLFMMNLFASVSFACPTPYDGDNEKSALWIVFGYPDSFDRCMKRNIYFARLVSPDKWKDAKAQLEWDENGLIAYKKESVRLLDRYFSSIDFDKNLVAGDLNGNGAVDVGDARIALRLAVGLDELTKELTLEKADVSVNDEIDIEDARILLRIAVRLESPFWFHEIHGFFSEVAENDVTDPALPA